MFCPPPPKKIARPRGLERVASHVNDLPHFCFTPAATAKRAVAVGIWRSREGHGGVTIEGCVRGPRGRLFPWAPAEPFSVDDAGPAHDPLDALSAPPLLRASIHTTRWQSWAMLIRFDSITETPTGTGSLWVPFPGSGVDARPQPSFGHSSPPRPPTPPPAHHRTSRPSPPTSSRPPRPIPAPQPVPWPRDGSMPHGPSFCLLSASHLSAIFFLSPNR